MDAEMSFIVIFILVCLGVVIGVLLYGRRQKLEHEEDVQFRKEYLTRVLNSEENFAATVTLFGFDNNYLFAVDERNKKILYVTEYGNKRVIDFDSILDFEIKTDDSIIQEKDTKIVDLILFDITTASILSDTKNIKHVKYLGIQITVRDLLHPIVDIDCLNAEDICHDAEKGVDTDIFSDEYKKCFEDANRILSILKVITKSNNKKSE